jgi:hypothetical protein
LTLLSHTLQKPDGWSDDDDDDDDDEDEDGPRMFISKVMKKWTATMFEERFAKMVVGTRIPPALLESEEKLRERVSPKMERDLLKALKKDTYSDEQARKLVPSLMGMLLANDPAELKTMTALADADFTR